MSDVHVPGGDGAPAVLAGRAARIARCSPYAQRGLSRWLARSGGIDAALQQGALPDPLFGNYRLLPLSHVVVASAARQRRYQVGALATKLESDQAGRYAMTTVANQETGTAADDRRLALVCADFDGDGRDEIAWVAAEAGRLHLVLARGSDGITVVCDTELPFANEGEVVLVSGVFHEPAGGETALLPQIVLGWVDARSTVRFELYTVGTDLTPRHVSSASAETLPSRATRYALAAGDVDGEGLDVLALACPGPTDVGARLYSIAEDGAFTAHPRTVIAPSVGEGGVALAFGDFNHDAVQELAALWEGTGDRAVLQLLVAGKAHALEARGRWEDDDPDATLTGAARLAITAGALAPAGPTGADTLPEQIVLGYEVGDHEVALRLLESDQGLNLGPKHLKAKTRVGAQVGYALTGFDLVLRCGGLVGGALNTVVLGSIGSSHNPLRVLAGYATVTVGMVPVAPDLSRFGALDVRAAFVDEQAQDKQGRFRLGLALGDLTGASVRVGPPKVHRADEVSQVLAVLNAPPSHQVLEDDVEPNNINFNGDAWLDFTNAKGEETEFRSELRKDWGYSEELRAGLRTPIVQVEGSLSRQYGEHFEDVTQQTVTTRLSLDKDQLWTEDAVVLVTTAYTVWEYDVYDSLTSASAGKLAVLFPDVRPPRVSIKGSKDILFNYFATHTLGNALSYPTVDSLPDDIADGRTLASVELTVGASQSKLMLTWETTEERTETRGTDQGVSLGVQGGFNPQFKGIQLGVVVDVDGRYGESEMSSVTTRMTENTEVTIAYNQLGQPQWRYTVEPIIYWSKRHGYLVVDYLVDIPESETFPTAWQNVYEDRCDLGFSLPWADEGSDGPYAQLTRDIYLRRSAEGGLTAEVTVRNQSLLQARAVRVDLYDDAISTETPVHSETLPLVAARGTSTFAHTWPAEPGRHTVRAVIDPDGEQPDLYRGNNVGWSRITL